MELSTLTPTGSQGLGALLRDFKIAGCCLTTTISSTPANTIRVPGVLLRDFDGGRLLALRSKNTYSKLYTPSTKRLTCIWYGAGWPEAVPRCGT